MALEYRPLEIDGLALLVPSQFADERGFFSETYNARALSEHGFDTVFVQDNHVYSARTGTVRGLHFQRPPHSQVKLVWVTRGSILDVVVDLRRSSKSFGRHIAIALSRKDWCQLLIPAGFAHGYCTLEPDTEVVYKVSDFYAPHCDAGIRWNDPSLAIAWPTVAGSEVSEKDMSLPFFSDAIIPLQWSERP
jgi:dTDP-4-dehydrorhamnose 3,5-epimerase